MHTLHVIDANKPKYLNQLVAEISNRDPEWVTVVYMGGLTTDETSVIRDALNDGENLHFTHYASTVSIAVNAARDLRVPTHLIVCKPVSYEPTASMFNLGGLTIPAVFDEELGPVLSIAGTVTICVKSHE